MFEVLIPSLVDMLESKPRQNYKWNLDSNDNQIVVSENSTSVFVRMPFAGANKQDFEVTLENGILSISGKRTKLAKDGETITYGNDTELSVGRKLKIGNDVDKDNIVASYENGILIIELKKTEKVLPKKIDIL